MDIPIDRKYNEKNFIDTLKIVNDLEYYVFYGTLLGLVRDGDLLEKDDDVDFQINRKHLTTVIERFNHVPYHLSLKNNIHDSAIIEDVIHNYTIFFQQASRKQGDTNTYIDMVFYEIGNNVVIDRWNFLGSPYYPEHHMHIPKDFIFPIQKKTYDKYGEINFPAQPEKCLEFLYGPKWMFPMKKKKQYTHKIVDNKPFLVM